MTSSLTAFAFAPGVLKTGTPSLLSFATGMLFVPAPARPTASSESGSVMSCILNERSRIASGRADLGRDLVAIARQPVEARDGDAVQRADLERRHHGAHPCRFAKSAMNAISASTPASGIAL